MKNVYVIKILVYKIIFMFEDIIYINIVIKILIYKFTEVLLFMLK